MKSITKTINESIKATVLTAGAALLVSILFRIDDEGGDAEKAGFTILKEAVKDNKLKAIIKTLKKSAIDIQSADVAALSSGLKDGDIKYANAFAKKFLGK